MTGRIRTQRQVCAYLDILGGAKLYQNSDPARASQFFKCVNEFERRLNNWTTHFPKLRSSSALVKTFSDNLVAAFPFRSSAKLTDSELVGLALSELKNQIHELTLFEGFPVRGGITVGQLLLTDQLLYGKALVDAVQLEGEAIFPRVLISESTLKYIRGTAYEVIVAYDSDGKAFLHYLDSSSSCQLHRDFVSKGLRENSGKVHERQKYEWLAQYHNFSARKVGRPDLCVDIERSDAFSIANVVTLNPNQAA